MRGNVCLIALIALAASVQVCAAENEAGGPDPYKELLSAVTIRVTLGPGVSTEWKKGAPHSELVKRFSDDPVMDTITYDQIDLQKGTARAIAKEGADDVKLFVHRSGITIIQTPNGGPIFTTIFATRNEKTQGFNVVTSRHVSLQDLGGPDVPSQYYGTAVITERK